MRSIVANPKAFVFLLLLSVIANLNAQGNMRTPVEQDSPADTLKGDTLTFDRKPGESIRIGTLTVSYNEGYTANITNPGMEYDGYETRDSFKLYEDGEEGIVEFLYISTNEGKDNVRVQTWKGYKIEILDDRNEVLRLKITKE
jgi:hypothetical protein